MSRRSPKGDMLMAIYIARKNRGVEMTVGEAQVLRRRTVRELLELYHREKAEARAAAGVE